MENTQPSYERLEKHGENISQSKDRALILRPKTTETKELFRVHRRKAETKARQSALSGNREIAVSGQQKESVRKKTHGVSATMRVNVENLRVLPVLLVNCRRTMGNIFEKKGRPEAAVYLKKSFEDRASVTLMEIARAPV